MDCELKCSSCGEQLPDDSNKCTRCGERYNSTMYSTASVLFWLSIISQGIGVIFCVLCDSSMLIPGIVLLALGAFLLCGTVTAYMSAKDREATVLFQEQRAQTYYLKKLVEKNTSDI